MMKKTPLAELSHLVKKELNDEITFQSVESDSNVLKAQIMKDGKKHAVYLLAIPEDNFDSFREEDYTKSDSPIEHELEYSS